MNKDRVVSALFLLAAVCWLLGGIISLSADYIDLAVVFVCLSAVWHRRAKKDNC